MTTPSDTLEYLEGTYGINYDLCCQCGRVAPTGIIRVEKYMNEPHGVSALGGGWFVVSVYRRAADSSELKFAFSRLTPTVDLSRWRFFPNAGPAADLLPELLAEQADHFKFCASAYAGVPGEGFPSIGNPVPADSSKWNSPVRQSVQDHIQPIDGRVWDVPVTSVRAGDHA